MTLSALIIDDETPARKRVSMLVRERSSIKILKECNNGTSAVSAINTLQPDLVFLDIQLGDMHGFDVLEQCDISPIIIFITAYDEFAIKAFNHFAFDFILKPFSNERFFESVDKVLQHSKQNPGSYQEKIDELLTYFRKREDEKNKRRFIQVKINDKTILVKCSDIVYISASGNYSYLHTHEKKHVVRDSISNLLASLAPEDFMRIHRSSVINVNFIESIGHNAYGESYVTMCAGHELRISRSYYGEFIEKLGLR